MLRKYRPFCINLQLRFARPRTWCKARVRFQANRLANFCAYPFPSLYVSERLDGSSQSNILSSGLTWIVTFSVPWSVSFHKLQEHEGSWEKKDQAETPASNHRSGVGRTIARQASCWQWRHTLVYLCVSRMRQGEQSKSVGRGSDVRARKVHDLLRNTLI